MNTQNPSKVNKATGTITSFIPKVPAFDPGVGRSVQVRGRVVQLWQINPPLQLEDEQMSQVIHVS